MDKIFIVHKQEFIAAINSTIDMLQNSLDLMIVKKDKGGEVDEKKFKEISDNISVLNKILIKYKTNKELNDKEQNLVVGALATSAVLMEYLANNYIEAAKKAKIIIANIQAKN